ncbi:DUF6030 family protein [Roseibium sp. AS2]|uniref:DUF6030 family protein n=1 Tax=Roseibium sp. AS2 TaxID=3135781 RepID=UPI003175820A
MTGLANRVWERLKAWRPVPGDGREDLRPGGRPAARGTGPRWAESEADDLQAPARDKPDNLAHPPAAGRPQVTAFYVWGTLALLMMGFALAGIALHLRQDVAGDTAPRLADPLSPLPQREREALLDPAPELAAELKRGFHGAPDTLCDELRALGLANQGWHRAPFQTGRWQCASDLVPLTTPSVDYGSTTLFFLLRGSSEDSIDYLRIKLVVEDPRQKQIGLDAVWLVIDALADRYGWTMPDRFRAAVGGFRQLETSHHGVRVSVAPEDPALTGDPLASGRLNIIMNFGESDLIRPADKFRQAPPLESGWEVKDRTGRAGE